MPKLKSNKKLSKRFTLTPTGKVKSRKPGQSHFNGRNTGNEISIYKIIRLLNCNYFLRKIVVSDFAFRERWFKLL